MTRKYLLDVPTEDIIRFEKEFFEFLDTKLGSAAYTGHGKARVDGRTEARVEHLRLQINLAVGDGDHVGGNVRGHVSGLGLIIRFEKEFFEFLDTKYPEVPGNIAAEKVISDETEETLKKAIEEFKKQFK